MAPSDRIIPHLSSHSTGEPTAIDRARAAALEMGETLRARYPTHVIPGADGLDALVFELPEPESASATECSLLARHNEVMAELLALMSGPGLREMCVRFRLLASRYRAAGQARN